MNSTDLNDYTNLTTQICEFNHSSQNFKQNNNKTEKKNRTFQLRLKFKLLLI
jgi:hypothetical protein